MFFFKSKNKMESRQWTDFFKKKIDELHQRSVTMRENDYVEILVGDGDYNGCGYRAEYNFGKPAIERATWTEKDYVDKSTRTVGKIYYSKLISISISEFNEIQTSARNKFFSVHVPKEDARGIMNELEEEL